MMSRFIAVGVTVLTICVSAACASGDDSSAAAVTDTKTSVASASSVAVASSAPAEAESSPGLVIDVSIDGSSVTPMNERFDAVVGEPVTLRVNSTVEDELHVHSVPDNSFEVAAATDQIFEFTVDVPGTVAIELHESGKTVATLLVRP